MNTIKNIKIAAIAVLAVGAFSACTEEMDDWGTDASYDRLFSPTSLSVTPESTSAEVEFGTVAGVQEYIIQISTDTLNDQVSELASLKSYTVQSSPVTVDGLVGDTYYYLRIRSISEGKKDSKWLYFSDSRGRGCFHTAKEQIMFPVYDENRGQDQITVMWTPGADVTHLLVQSADIEDYKIQLDADAKQAGSYTITDLMPSTSYTISIWLNEAQRGTVTASTTAAAPKGDFVFYMTSQISLTNEMMEEISEQAKSKAENPDSYSATIVIPAGAVIDMSGLSEAGDPASLKIPEGMSVTFFGAAGVQPVVKLTKSINIGGKHSYIRFQNLTITEGGCTYVINQSDAATVDELSFTSCNINDIANGCIVRVQGSNEVVIGTINVDDCFINNMADKYYMFDLRGSKQNVGTFNMTNSTVWNSARFFQNTGNDMAGGVNVSNTTFNDIIASGRYFIDCNGKKSDINLNSIIIGTLKAGGRGVRTSGATNYVNVYQTNDVLVPATEEKSASKFASNDMKIEIKDKSAAEIFTDPANGDFTLKIEDKVGAPYWYSAE